MSQVPPPFPPSSPSPRQPPRPSQEQLESFFARGQKWLTTHGKRPEVAEDHQGPHEGTLDISRTYVRQQVKSKFVVMT